MSFNLHSILSINEYLTGFQALKLAMENFTKYLINFFLNDNSPKNKL